MRRNRDAWKNDRGGRPKSGLRRWKDMASTKGEQRFEMGKMRIGIQTCVTDFDTLEMGSILTFIGGQHWLIG
jgi:hypothetical protein